MYRSPTRDIAAALVIMGAAALAPVSESVAGQHSDAKSALELRVVDADSEEPIFGATARVEEPPRETFTDESGEAHIEHLPGESVNVEVDFTGYETSNFVVELEAGSLAERSVELEPEIQEESQEPDSVEVTTTGRRVSTSDVYRPTSVLSGEELQRNISNSVPATLESVPGFNAQYNGPGASSPTIRGLPGDRVLMLEEGHRTGDIYWTASDHGVMSEPLSATRMEVVRGPAGLLYGPNALGGAANVIRDDIPQRRSSEPEVTVRSMYESVNDGIGAGATLSAPAGPLNLYGEATARRVGNSQTPLGEIPRSGMRVFNGGLGASWLPDWGAVGAAVRHYDNIYDIPGEFDGELIPGGHPGGVTSEARRTTARLQTRYDESLGPFDDLELKSNLTLFNHDEIEGTIGDEEVLGARFNQTSTDSRLIARHDPIGDDDGLSAEGALGLSFQTRDLEAGGASPGTRSGLERDIGVFGYEEFDLELFRLQAALRYDFRYVTTDDLSDLQTRTEQRTIIKEVSPRTFPASFSGSLAALLDLTDNWTIGTSLSRSVRHPTIEELYSDGPHLADFSFDIGDPDLSPETGLGADVFVRANPSGLSLELAGYANRIDDYIYYNPTGETVRVHREGVAPRTTPVFEARGDDATFIGAEGRIEWEIIDDLTFDATATYTVGTRREADDPLPFIPPLSGQLELRYDQGSFFGGLGAKVAGPQNRIPRPVEIGDTTQQPQQRTDGYALARAHAGWRWDTSNYGHTLMLNVDNATNRVWRDHMSRIKEVAPQPGRNIKISYEAMF